MDSPKMTWVVSLENALCRDPHLVGGKAASLARLLSSGIRVPTGFCLTVLAYQHVLAHSDLPRIIQMELGRKPLDTMRWEEIWDAALRIRSAFLKVPIPDALVRAIHANLDGLHGSCPLAVRSSAPGEDSTQRSFAGLHESIVDIQDHTAVIQAVRTVWASLWSDAALLYRKELGLDPLHSQMAVIVQEMVPADISGVAFGRDPRNQEGDREIVEAVPGPCSNLVDGMVEPDRWILTHSSGEILEWQGGKRDAATQEGPLLQDQALYALHTQLGQIEELFGWPPDMEWADTNGRLAVLQTRPITSGTRRSQPDERRWYLTLRPKLPHLRRLADRVAHTFIPDLEHLGHQLAGESLDTVTDPTLANIIEHRKAILNSWRDIYKQEFIPLAHGVRYFGAFYNDVLQPDDPYEFMILLEGQHFIASQRNTALIDLAQRVNDNPGLRAFLSKTGSHPTSQPSQSWDTIKAHIQTIEGGPDFLHRLETFLTTFMDTSYNGERLIDRPESVLRLIGQLGLQSSHTTVPKEAKPPQQARAFEARLLEIVGPARAQEAKELLAIGQLSWRLRDDDNILLGRIESQFLRALHLGAERLRTKGRLTGGIPREQDTEQVVQGLRDPHHPPTHITSTQASSKGHSRRSHEKPRQLIGQPASPGLAEGTACVVDRIDDFQKFRQGDILVCESIQPTMTHLVPLAAAIVERRGGMLIHGAIITRELGIPCVNGIPDATTVIDDGDQLTVDGFLGIVSLGAPVFDLEHQAFSHNP